MVARTVRKVTCCSAAIFFLCLTWFPTCSQLALRQCDGMKASCGQNPVVGELGPADTRGTCIDAFKAHAGSEFTQCCCKRCGGVVKCQKLCIDFYTWARADSYFTCQEDIRAAAWLYTTSFSKCKSSLVFD